MTTATLGRETGRLERRKARTRAAILSAASELFQQHGYEATSIQQIAELADTGVGTVYGYFVSKDEVLHEVLREHSQAAVENYRASIDSSTPPIDKLSRGLAEYRRYIRDNMKLLTAAFYVATRDARMLEDSNEWLSRGYAQMIQEGIDRGDFKVVPADSAARMLLSAHSSAVLGIGAWRSAEPGRIDADLDELTRALLLR